MSRNAANAESGTCGARPTMSPVPRRVAVGCQGWHQDCMVLDGPVQCIIHSEPYQGTYPLWQAAVHALAHSSLHTS